MVLYDYTSDYDLQGIIDVMELLCGNVDFLNDPTEIQQIAHIAKSIHLAKKENPKSNTATLESQIDSIVSRLHNIR